MGKKDKRVDAYIIRAAEFAQPILEHLRELVHKGCPDVEETIKWGFPHFDYHGIMCSMAAFKQHSAFSFWKASLIPGTEKLLSTNGESSMGDLGPIRQLAGLPPDKVLLRLIKEAARLNEEGVKVVRKPKPAERKPLIIPLYFKKALSKNAQALNTFEAFSYSHRKDYLEWITEAKTEETRNKRMATAIEWMAEGKSRNWKYERK